MQDVLFQLISLVVLSVSLGLVLGVLFTRGGYRRKLESLHREKEAEFRAEKTEISRELGAELARIRESIVQTVDAYEAAVQVLEDRLPNPEEQHLRLEVKVAAPLAVEYKQSREGFPAAALSGRGGLRRALQADEVSPVVVAMRDDTDIREGHFSDHIPRAVIRRRLIAGDKVFARTLLAACENGKIGEYDLPFYKRLRSAAAR